MGRSVKSERWASQSGADNPVKPENDFDELVDDLDEFDDDVEDAGGRDVLEESSSTDLSGIRANVRTGGREGSKTNRREVKPAVTGPRVDNNASGSTCTPDDFAIGDLSWNVVDKGKKGWGVKVTGLTTSGQIKVNPTPNHPTTMTAPNTPNPVDGGNIENNEGSDADWRAVLDSLTGYHTKNGGRGDWHDTAASTAHEWAHWNTDWMKNCLGTTWPVYRRKMERLRVSKSKATDVGQARAILAPKVEAKLNALDSKATKKWNAVPDEPGDWFANGYKAGQQVLDGHVKRVEKYADKKAWSLLGKVKKALTPGAGGTANAAPTT
jgi:hypothetical protein